MGQHGTVQRGLAWGEQRRVRKGPFPKQTPLELGTLLGTPSKYRHTPWDPTSINQDPQIGDIPSLQRVMHPPGIPPRATKRWGSPGSPSN